MNELDIDQLWVSEWSPKGSLHARKLRDHLAINRSYCQRNEMPAFIPLQVFASLEQAVAFNQEIKKIKKGSAA